MSAYRLELAASAERILARLPESAIAAVIEFMTGRLLENPQRVGTALKLEFEGYRAARRGPYRIVYRVEDEPRIVRVVRIDHRADVYRPR